MGEPHAVGPAREIERGRLLSWGLGCGTEPLAPGFEGARGGQLRFDDHALRGFEGEALQHLMAWGPA